MAGLDVHAAVAAATRGNVIIYPIDPAGISPELTPLSTRMDMVALGQVTGGFALASSNSFSEAFSRIVRENSTYYTLGFNSSYARRDGRFVRLDVRVKRPGLQVRTREGYVAPRGRVPAAARAENGLTAPALGALASPLATRGVTLQMFAAPYKSARRDAAVALVIEVDVTTLGLVERNGQWTGTLEVTYTATDARKRVHPGGRHSLALAFDADTYARVAASGVRIVSQLALPSGRYQVRGAASSGTRSGSVVYDLEVPDLHRARSF